MNASQSTVRFEIWKTTVKHYGAPGTLPRKVFFAFLAAEPESSRLIAVVVVDDNLSSFVEWLHVDSEMRRRGVATEVLQFVEQHGSELTLSAATPEGDAFTKAYTTRFPRLGLVNNVFSAMQANTERFEFWVTKLERMPGNGLEIVQIWPRDENLARPVCVMTIDRAKSKRVKLIYVDGIDWEATESEILAGIETMIEAPDCSDVTPLR